MFGNMMGKLQEMQQKAEEVKKRLDTISVEAASSDNLIKVVCTANRKITNIEISEELLKDKEQLEDLVLTTVNKALEKAEKVNETEMQGVAKGMIPGM